MRLLKSEILEEINKGNIKIDPFDPSMVGAATVDFSLGPKVRVFKTQSNPIDLDEDFDYKEFTEEIDIGKDGYTLKPGEFILSSTKENLILPENLSGEIYTRSRFARIGLESQMTAPLIHPGSSGPVVMEIHNTSQYAYKLRSGVFYFQVTFIKCIGQGVHEGRYPADNF